MLGSLGRKNTPWFTLETQMCRYKKNRKSKDRGISCENPWIVPKSMRQLSFIVFLYDFIDFLKSKIRKEDLKFNSFVKKVFFFFLSISNLSKCDNINNNTKNWTLVHEEGGWGTYFSTFHIIIFKKKKVIVNFYQVPS